MAGDAGTYTITIELTDDNANPSTSTYTFDIIVSANTAPYYTTTPLTSPVSYKEAYVNNYVLQNAIDDHGDTITVQAYSNPKLTLPSFVTLSSPNLLVFSPLVGDANTYTI